MVAGWTDFVAKDAERKGCLNWGVVVVEGWTVRESTFDATQRSSPASVLTVGWN